MQSESGVFAMTGLVYIGTQDALTYSYEKHRHSCWEITYYCEGEGLNITGGIEYPFTSGTIICQPPQLLHEDISDSGYKNIFFMVESFSLSVSMPVVVQDTANKDFLYILKQLYNEYYTGNDTEITDALLNVLYEYLLRRIGSGIANSYVDLLKREMICNLSNPNFSILEQIGQFQISVNHFRRLFESDTGIAPLQYLQSLRMTHAKRLLENSSRPIGDICFLCGFTDPYYFSRIFKKCCGINPSAWRKKNRSIGNIK